MSLAQQQIPASSFSARVAPLVCAVVGSAAVLLSSAVDAHAQSTPLVLLDISRGSIDADGSADAFATTLAGAGFDVAVGLRSAGLVWFHTAELSAGFHDFGGALDPKVSRSMLGSRLGIDWIVRPSVFAHFGVGYVSIDDGAPGAAPAIGLDWAGDLGLSLDVEVAPGVEIGATGSASWVGFSDSFQWLQAGGHVTFLFGG